MCRANLLEILSANLPSLTRTTHGFGDREHCCTFVVKMSEYCQRGTINLRTKTNASRTTHLCPAELKKERVYSPTRAQRESSSSRQPECSELVTAGEGRAFLIKNASRTTGAPGGRNSSVSPVSCCLPCHLPTAAHSIYHGRCIRIDRCVGASRTRSAHCGRSSCNVVQGGKQGTK